MFKFNHSSVFRYQLLTEDNKQNMRETFELNAARQRDLITILENFSIYQQFINGQSECSFCSDTLTWENLGGLVIRFDKPTLFCDTPECVEQASKEKTNA
jgi:hypothetical protein